MTDEEFIDRAAIAALQGLLAGNYAGDDWDMDDYIETAAAMAFQLNQEVIDGKAVRGFNPEREI